MEMRRVFISGINGQLGSYLTEHLLEQGHKVQALYHGTRPLPKGVEPAAKWIEADDVYLLHIIRPAKDMPLTDSLEHGLLSVAATIEESPNAQILVPDSYAATQGVGPKNWLKDKELTRKLVSMHSDRVVMPTLSQFISPRGNPSRMYLMWVLHEIAAGRYPKPQRPMDIVRPDHAKNGAFKLAEGMQGRWASVPEPAAMTVSEFIHLAFTPGTWVECIVQKIKQGGR